MNNWCLAPAALCRSELHEVSRVQLIMSTLEPGEISLRNRLHYRAGLQTLCPSPEQTTPFNISFESQTLLRTFCSRKVNLLPGISHHLLSSKTKQFPCVYKGRYFFHIFVTRNVGKMIKVFEVTLLHLRNALASANKPNANNH